MTNLTEDKILNFISETLLGGKTVSATDDLLLSGLLDSLAVMSLVAFLEKEGNVQIPAQDLTIENFASVKDISTYLSTLSS
jgi:acyl carrier protein